MNVVGRSDLVPGPGEPEYHPGIRPRDAASLILVRRDGEAPRILMGRRHAGHRFMPGMVVFPGGRVDRADYMICADHGGSFAPATRVMLLQALRGRASERRARAIALAAIRETFEETGILVGRATDPDMAPPTPEGWRAFFERGVVPDVGPLHLVARAITPPGFVRRFDTRFFLVEARAIAGSGAPPSDELEAPSWLSFAEARRCELPSITRMILDIAESRLDALGNGQVAGPAPFFRMRHGQRVIETLTPTFRHQQA
jgi:8-oxo-dGTP pyrophosphatase MutT (NUDIX family)